MLIEKLKSQCGQKIHESDWYKITQEQINQFALATNDHQWIHTDPERAKTQSPFSGTIAHGYLTLSLYSHLRGLVDTESPSYPGVEQVINYGINKLRLMNPVKVNAHIKGSTILLAAEESEHGIRITEEFTVHIQGEKKPALVGELLVLLKEVI